MDSRDSIRRTLRDRVAKRVAGQGVPRHAIDRAVDAVVDALPTDVIEDSPGQRTAGPARSPQSAARSAVPAARSAVPAGDRGVAEVVLAVTAVSVPDLASRVRGTLDRAGVRVSDAATATAGRHTVVTVRVRADARAAAEQAATAAGWKVSLVA